MSRTVLFMTRWAPLLVAAALGAGALGCSTLADDCRDSQCWLPADGTGGATSLCGNGEPDPGEECDDHNHIDADGCEADCTLPRCQNGIVDPGELCLTARLDVPTDALGPIDLVVFDCDGDGDQDLITLDQDSESITALANDGTGQLSVAAHSAAPQPVAMALGNLDSDPDLELHVALYSVNAVLTIFDNDQCSFTVKDTDSEVGAGVHDVLAFPFAGDEIDDRLALRNDTILFLDTNQGTWVNIDALAADPAGAAMGDLTGDGQVDLLYVSEADDELVVRRSLGTGFATEAGHYGVTSPTASAIGDLDGDGDLDVAVASGQSTVRLFFNNGAGNLVAAGDLALAAGSGVPAEQPVDLTLADLDADGDLDIATANRLSDNGTSSISVFLNDGTGSFVHAVTALAPLVSSESPLPVSASPTRVAAVDLNGDGALDLVATSAVSSDGSSLLSLRLSEP